MIFTVTGHKRCQGLCNARADWMWLFSNHFLMAIRMLHSSWMFMCLLSQQA